MRSLLILGVVVPACSSPADTVLDMTYDACAPVALHAPRATAAQRLAIDVAAAMWRDRGFAGIGDPAGASGVTLEFEPAGPASFGYFDDEHGVIYVNSELGAHETAITVAHELGHAFGLWHVQAGERPSVMNPGNLAIEPNAGDQRAVEGVWGACATLTTP